VAHKLSRYANPIGIGSRIPPLFVPLKVAVKYLGVIEETVHRWADEGKITSRRNKQNQREYLFLDIVNLLKENKRKAADAARQADKALKEATRGRQQPKED